MSDALELTPGEHETSAAVDEAARWVATSRRDRSRAPIPVLRERFGLSAKEACLALAEANLIKACAL
jgi:hypothetical protein